MDNLTPPNWALAYLRGRADAFKRGKLTRNNLLGAVRMALQRGVRWDEVYSVLERNGLALDPDELPRLRLSTDEFFSAD